MKDEMKVLENFKQEAVVFSELLGSIDWPKKDTVVINRFFKSCDYLYDLSRKHLDGTTPFTEKTQRRLTAIANNDYQEVSETWEAWKLHLSANHGEHYSDVQETCAINFIYKLANHDPKIFVNALQYAMMNNYKKINAEIIPLVTPTAISNPKTLFKDSPFADFTKFKKAFGRVYENVDLKFYFDKLWYWSEAEGRTSANWISVAKQFIQNDARQDKEVLAVLNNKLRAETKTDVLGRSSKAKAIQLLTSHFKYMQTLPPAFWQNVKPVKLEGNTLTVCFDFAKSQLPDKQVQSNFQELINQINSTDKTDLLIEITKA